MVDTLDLGSSAERCESSSLSVRTKYRDLFTREKGAAPEKGCAFSRSGGFVLIADKFNSVLEWGLALCCWIMQRSLRSNLRRGVFRPLLDVCFYI